MAATRTSKMMNVMEQSVFETEYDSKTLSRQKEIIIRLYGRIILHIENLKSKGSKIAMIKK